MNLDKEKRGYEILETYLKPMLSDFRVQISLHLTQKKATSLPGYEHCFHFWMPPSYNNMVVRCIENEPGEFTWFAGSNPIETTLSEHIIAWLRDLKEQHEEILSEINSRL